QADRQLRIVHEAIDAWLELDEQPGVSGAHAGAAELCADGKAVGDIGPGVGLLILHRQRNPWADVADRFPVGAQFSGTIVRSTDFGLFVELEPGVDGLVHYSQLPFGVKQGDPSIAIGTFVTGWVREVDPSKKRLSLSLREVA